MIKPTNENCVYQGKYGRVWKMRPDLMEPGPRRDLTKAGYLVWAPGYSPVAEHFLIAAVSLAAYPGMDTPTIYQPGATHEVFAMTVMPEGGAPAHDIPPTELVLDGQVHTVLPPNYVGQGVYDSDYLVDDKCYQAAKDMADRVLQPSDTGGWIARFGDSNVRPEHKAAFGLAE